MMNNKFVMPMIMSVLAMTLAGCDEGEDGIFNTNNNELEINHFERVNNNIARVTTDYRDGARDIDVTNVKGSFNTSSIDDLPLSTVLANNFEGTLEDRYIKVNGRTVTQPIYAKNSNERFDYKVTYKTLNLSGVDARDYSSNSRRGILTDLNNYPKIPRDIGFPSGSVCYIPVVSSERSFFTFNTKDKTKYNNLEVWTENAEARFGDNRQSSTTKLNIGVNNQQKAVQVKFFSFDNEPEYLYSGIDYDNSIYEADFISQNQARPNEDSIRGVIDCTLVNDTAADFLERVIKRYY